jgi:hypothetical protein
MKGIDYVLVSHQMPVMKVTLALSGNLPYAVCSHLSLVLVKRYSYTNVKTRIDL